MLPFGAKVHIRRANRPAPTGLSNDGYRTRSNANEASAGAGFTIVELLVSVSIIAILVAIALPILVNAQLRANDVAGSAAAANGAKAAAGMILTDPTSVSLATTFPQLATGNVVSVAVTAYDGADLASLCVTSTYSGGNVPTASAGPGCP